MADTDPPTARLKRDASLSVPSSLLYGLIGLATGGGIGTAGGAAALRGSVDQLTEQVGRLEVRVERLNDGRITREEVEARADARRREVDARFDKLEERLRVVESRPR